MTFLFSCPSFYSLSRELLADSFLEQGSFLVERFPNQEMHITINNKVQNTPCILLGSITPPDSNLLSLLMLSDTLKKEGAQFCLALLPYLAYSRHEHIESKKSQATALIGKLLRASGIDHVLTIDVHSPEVTKLFPLPLTSISPATLFAKELKKIAFFPDTIISPDLGAIQRCQDLSDALQKNTPIICTPKLRKKERVYHSPLEKPVGKKVVIVDDILDTGSTLISCIEQLVTLEVEEIIIMISHGLFSTSSWQQLKKFPIQKIYCLDGTKLEEDLAKDPLIHQLFLSPLIKDAICSLPFTSPLTPFY